MASNGYQTSFLPQLTPDEPLDPACVMIGDPRWSDCLHELASAKWIGLDTEFYGPKGPWKLKTDIDYWKSNVRLIQIGLPSRRVMVFNLGGMLDDRQEKIRTHWESLQQLKRVIDNRNVPKVGMAMLTEYMLLRIHFGWKMRGMRDVMLMSQVIWAGVGSKGGFWSPDGFVTVPVMKHSLGAICARLNIPIDKSEQESDWAGRLTNKQINYAVRDALAPYECWQVLARIAKDDGVIRSVQAECSAQPAFCECEFNGMPIDLDVARTDLAKWEKVRDEFWRPFRETFPGSNPGSPNQVAELLGDALDVRQCGSCGEQYDPMQQKPLGQPLAHQPATWRCPRCGGPREGYARLNRKDRSFWSEKVERGKLVKRPVTNDNVLAPFDKVWYVYSLLEGRSTATCLNWLKKAIESARDEGNGPRIRVDFKQIAGGYQEHGGSDGEAGRGMGRSSASNPINSQNAPNLQSAHEKAGAPHVRRAIRARPGRAYIVADLSQAHMRIAAQWSQDPILLRDFNLGIDAHLSMTHRVMQKKDFPELQFDEVVAAYKQNGKDGKPAHPLFKRIKSQRQGCKSTNYAALNLSGGETLQNQMATQPDPLHMELEDCEDLLNTWRNDVYTTLAGKQRDHIRNCNQYKHRFDNLGIDGEYGESRALTNRRLFLIKEWKKPFQRPDGSIRKGYWTVKATDSVSSIWMMTEADLIKYGMGKLVDVFDAHDPYFNPDLSAGECWDVLWSNMAHDEVNLDCAEEFKISVAAATQKAFDEAMLWAGIVDLPVSDNPKPEKLIVESWADK